MARLFKSTVKADRSGQAVIYYAAVVVSLKKRDFIEMRMNQSCFYAFRQYHRPDLRRRTANGGYLTAWAIPADRPYLNDLFLNSYYRRDVPGFTWQAPEDTRQHWIDALASDRFVVANALQRWIPPAKRDSKTQCLDLHNIPN